MRHFLARQSAQRCPTKQDIADRAGVDLKVIWNLEANRSVSAAAVLGALTKGLGYAPDSPQVHQALALLTARNAGGKVSAAPLAPTIAQAQMQAAFCEFLDRAVPVLATISVTHYDAVLEALGNPATVESLGALNKLAATSTSQKPRLRVVSKKATG